MPKSREDFMPDVGGFLDGMSGDIVDATFELASGEYLDRIMAGSSDAKAPVMLRLTIESPELEKPASQSYSVGSSGIWDIAADGKSISNNKAPDKKQFRKGSTAWVLVEAMMTAAGEGDFDKGQNFFIQRDAYMTEAAFYEGTSWFWEVKEIVYDIGGRKVTSRPPLPASLLGERKVEGKEAVDTSELDLTLATLATGKDELELRKAAIKAPEIKANAKYLQSIVSGAKIKELIASGMLTKGSDGKFA